MIAAYLIQIIFGSGVLFALLPRQLTNIILTLVGTKMGCKLLQSLCNARINNNEEVKTHVFNLMSSPMLLSIPRHRSFV